MLVSGALAVSQESTRVGSWVLLVPVAICEPHSQDLTQTHSTKLKGSLCQSIPCNELFQTHENYFKSTIIYVEMLPCFLDKLTEGGLSQSWSDNRNAVRLPSM